MERLRTLPLPVLILGGAVVGLLLLIFLGSRPEVSAPQERAWPVEVLIAKSGSYHPNLRLYGRVESPQEAKLEASVESDVLATPAKEGQFVKKRGTLSCPRQTGTPADTRPTPGRSR